MRQRPLGRQLRRLGYAFRKCAARRLRSGANRLIIVFFCKVILLMMVGLCLAGVKGRTYAVNTTKEKSRRDWRSLTAWGAYILPGTRDTATCRLCRTIPIAAAHAMSAYGYERTFTHTVIYVRFTPESGHSHGSRKRSAYDPKRTWLVMRLVSALGVCV